jgi:hypothetical protein
MHGEDDSSQSARLRQFMMELADTESRLAESQVAVPACSSHNQKFEVAITNPASRFVLVNQNASDIGLPMME